MIQMMFDCHMRAHTQITVHTCVHAARVAMDSA